MPMSPSSTPLLNPTQIFNLTVVAWCAVATASLAVIQAALSLYQRWRDLRLRQAEMALRLVDEALRFSPSLAALNLLDEHAATYAVDEGSAITFTHEDVRIALAVPPADFSTQSGRIRYCFDSLFYYLDRFERLIRVRALSFEDIDTPWGWYATQLAKEKELYRRYLDYIGYGRANSFLNRYQSWRAA